MTEMSALGCSEHPFCLHRILRGVYCRTSLLTLLLVHLATSASAQEWEPADIKLQSRTIEHPQGIEPELSESLAARSDGRVRSILKFNEPLSGEDLSELEQFGVRLLSYLGNGAYIAAVPSAASLRSERVDALLGFAGALTPDDKISPRLKAGSYEDWALAEAPNRVRVLVQFFSDVTVVEARREVESLDLRGRPHGPRSWSLVVDMDRIRRIAELDVVQWIEQGPIPLLLLNETSRRRSNSNEAQAADLPRPRPVYRVGGHGVRIGISDTGVDNNHDDFAIVTLAGQAAASRVYTQEADSDGHGTHVASIAAGNGLNSVNNGLPAFHRRGHAPTAEIGAYPAFGSALKSYHDATLNDGTDVTNHSYVQSMTVYDSVAADIDSILRGAATYRGNAIPGRPHVWAAGNNGTQAEYGYEEGYHAVFTSAKNPISVGSIDARDGRLSKFSSLGPTFDGRIKPDVVAPGCRDSIPGASVGIMAAANNTQGYSGGCGTSMAAPVVTGVIGLLMDQYTQTNDVFPNISPSTYKAILVHTARDQVKTRPHGSREFHNPDTDSPVLYHAGPDFATGYGLVDAEGARNLIADSSRWTEGSIAATGTEQVWCINVAAGSAEVKATLAWDDEPGSTLSAEFVPKLVNDLDLHLMQPGGTMVRPWTLDPLPLTSSPGNGALDPIAPEDVNPAYRGVDRRNNVEMANVALPLEGDWRIVVRAYNLPFGSAQAFSLASSHPLSQCP